MLCVLILFSLQKPQYYGWIVLASILLLWLFYLFIHSHYYVLPRQKESEISRIKLNHEGECECYQGDSFHHNNSPFIQGQITALSRVSPFGAWVVVESVKLELSAQTLFLFKDSMDLRDFKRLCRVIRYVKHAKKTLC